MTAMDKFEAQHGFWSSFGVPAFEENSVPDRDTLREWDITDYITYTKVNGVFGSVVQVNPSIWTRSTTWDRADALQLAIQNRLENGGERISYDGGMIWATADDGGSFAQSMGDPDDDQIKRYRLAVNLQFS